MPGSVFYLAPMVQKDDTQTATWADYHAEGYRIYVHCDPCNREVLLDLAKMPPNGNVIGAKLRCSPCGGRGHMIVQPAQSIGRRPT